MMLSCEAPSLAINVLQTTSCCRIRGSYEHDPIPSHCKSDLNECLPEWCARPTASYRLLSTTGDKMFQLGSEKFVTVGRNASAKVVLSSLSVSRMHAAFMHDSLNQTFLVDLGSTHGTFIGSEQLKPYTPTLVTKKSLIRFGTCEIQYLLVTLCTEQYIAQEAMQQETDAERELYFNTQFNLIKTLPASEDFGMDTSDLSFSRVDTFNFKRRLGIPSLLKGVNISSDSVAAYDKDELVVVPTSMQVVENQCPAYEGTLLGLPSLVSHPRVSLNCHLHGFGNATDSVPMSDGSMSISLSPELQDRSIVKSNDFVFSGNVSGELSIKRCASTAGVDDSDLADFALCEGYSDEDSVLRSRRRRMSEDPNDYGSYDSGRSMSLSIESGEVASIGGSSTGFISSGSMSECEEGDDAVLEKKKRKVRFWEIPMEIPEPDNMGDL